MLAVLIICLLLFELACFGIFCDCWSINHRIVKATNNSYFMVESDNTIRALPDEFTALKLFRMINASHCPDCSIIAALTNEELSRFTISTRYNPSLQVQGWESPDEVIRIVANEANYLEYPWWWLETVSFGFSVSGQDDAMNPSIVKWFGKFLMVHRISYSVKKTQLDWWKDDLSGPDNNMVHLGIKTGFILPIQGNQEDARAIVLKNNSLMIIYGKTYADHSYMTYVIGTLKEEDNNVEFYAPIEMRHTNYSNGWIFNKNWLPFYSSNKKDNNLYFLQFVNPPTILLQKDPLLWNKDYSEVVTVYGVDSTKSEDFLTKKIDIPWNKHKYGVPRGGTPPIHFKGYLLSFFHTLNALQASQYKRHTYLMGAILYNSKPPFNVVKSSRVPIMPYGIGKGPFYEDHWFMNVLDYVVFPCGAYLSEDEKYIWLSFGYQDGRGYLAKLDANGLFASLHDFAETDDKFGFNATDGWGVNVNELYVNEDKIHRRKMRMRKRLRH